MTTLTATVETSLANIRDIGRDIGENIARLQEEAKLARQQAIEPFLQALADSGEVSLIVVYGSTPSFNDGEPCEHSADFFVNIEQAIYYDAFDLGVGLDEEKFEWVEELIPASSYNAATHSYDINASAVEENTKLCAGHGHVYKAPSDQIMTAIDDVIFRTAEEENGTNYYVAYVLKDGKFEKSSGDYDCGY